MITTWGSSWCHLTSVGGYCHRAAIFRCSTKCASHKWHLIDISDASSDCHRAVIAMPFQGCTICFVTFLRVQQFKIQCPGDIAVSVYIVRCTLHIWTIYEIEILFMSFWRILSTLCFSQSPAFLKRAGHNVEETTFYTATAILHCTSYPALSNT